MIASQWPLESAVGTPARCVLVESASRRQRILDRLLRQLLGPAEAQLEGYCEDLPIDFPDWGMDPAWSGNLTVGLALDLACLHQDDGIAQQLLDTLGMLRWVTRFHRTDILERDQTASIKKRPELEELFSRLQSLEAFLHDAPDPHQNRLCAELADWSFRRRRRMFDSSVFCQREVISAGDFRMAENRVESLHKAAGPEFGRWTPTRGGPK